MSFAENRLMTIESLDKRELLSVNPAEVPVETQVVEETALAANMVSVPENEEAASVHTLLPPEQILNIDWVEPNSICICPIEYSPNPSLSTGQSLSNNIDYPGKEDTYLFQAMAGQTYVFSTELGSLKDSVITLYSADGTEIASDDDGGIKLSSRLEWTAQESGQIAIVVRAFDNSQTGSYQIRAAVVDDHANTAEAATSLEVGETLNGYIGESGDVDLFRFQAVAGQTYIISAELHGLPDSVITLYTKDGIEVARDDDGGEKLSSRLEWTATESGEFFVGVRAFGTEQTGQYTIHAAAIVSEPEEGTNQSGPNAGLEQTEPNEGSIATAPVEGTTESTSNEKTGAGATNFNITATEPTGTNSSNVVSSTPTALTTTLPPNVTFTNGVLRIDGTDQSEEMTITESATEIIFSLRSGASPTPTVHRIPKQQSGVNITRIDIFGHAGDDLIRNDTSIASVISGGNGNDRLYGGSGNDSLHGDAGDDHVSGGAGDDYLAGGAGDDKMWGGEGNDGLHGGAGIDELVGGLGQDRFLRQTGDQVLDVAAEDAIVNFVNSNSAAWTDAEIESVDEAFRVLQARTGNTHLLKDPVSSVPITFERVDHLPEKQKGMVTLADNTDPVQPTNSFEWGPDNWSGTEFKDSTTPTRRIRLTDDVFSGAFNFQKTLLHEIGHNWDSAKEIGRVLPGLGGLWNLFADLHAKAQTATDNGQPDAFVSDYAETSEAEDFAESFAYSLLGGTSTNPLMQQRYAILDQIFGAVAAKGAWDGHPDDQETVTTEEQFNSWLEGRREALKGFFRSLDPSQWSVAFPQFNSEMFANLVPSLDASKLGEVLGKLNTDTFQQVLSHMSASQLGQAFKALDGATLKSALAELHDGRLVHVFKELDGKTLKAAIDRLSVSRVTNILERVDVNTLKAAINQMSLDGLASVYEGIHGESFNAFLEGMDVSKVTQVLERVNVGTMRAALKRLSDLQLANVLEKFSGRALSTALDQISTQRIADVLRKVNVETLTSSLKRLDDGMVANVCELLHSRTLEKALDVMNPVRIATVLKSVNVSTLKTSLSLLSKSDAPKVFEHFTKKTLGKALDVMKAKDIARILDKVNSVTLHNALDVLSPDLADEVIGKLGKAARDAVKTIKDVGKKLDPSGWHL